MTLLRNKEIFGHPKIRKITNIESPKTLYPGRFNYNPFLI